ncbi:hypothetical protein DM01DRAFT_1383751 [Hesseltinella vesiculosa]|uniref:VanZ-like domain-containing protein n=1 Tax=Hesseltinella vesiculosa TaxID=101127 RepID=A0A1X2GGH0_9FUNG|nr:hypothetical protein DM01DRAFT_1383751 [Hesseltinella vesiculosa]
MRLQVLVVIFFLLILMGILGFAPIHVHEHVNDKVLHFMTFCILSVCLYYVWNLSFQRNLLLATSIMLVMSIGSEFIQDLLPYRTFDVWDIVANLLGSGLGLILAFGLDYGWHARKEHQRRWGGTRVAMDQQALMDDLDLEQGSDDDLDHFSLPAYGK